MNPLMMEKNSAPQTGQHQFQNRRTPEDLTANSSRTILVPFDFSESCKLALENALTLARKRNSSILVVHVIEPTYAESFLDDAVKARVFSQVFQCAQRKLDETIAAKRASRDIKTEIRFGLPHYEILKVAEAVEPEMIVMGRRNRNFWQRMISGSVSRTILDVSPFPVLVVNESKKIARGATVDAQFEKGALSAR